MGLFWRCLLANLYFYPDIPVFGAVLAAANAFHDLLSIYIFVVRDACPASLTNQCSMITFKRFRNQFLLITCIVLLPSALKSQDNSQNWIRINQLGYKTDGVKVAVFGSKERKKRLKDFELIDARSLKVVFKKRAGKDYGQYGPFNSTYRLDFSGFKKNGRFYLQAEGIKSPEFEISQDIYKGSPDFTLRYMRQQRSGFNPFLKDSCHTKDGYIIYGPVPENTHLNVSGGWHDATDYLQYSTTSANATYHLLAAYRDFPGSFTDKYLSNGLEGPNGTADVLDEAKWGLDWLLKMHPKEDWMFNQLADDRDHAGFRLPTEDSVDYGYGKGNGRPVYYITGEPQGLGKYKNRATGAASTAGKFAGAFALAAQIYESKDRSQAENFKKKALSAYKLGLSKPGVAQTAPNKAPYFYEEDNWTDDMELGAAALYQLTGEKVYFEQSEKYSEDEKVTPWMGADTAKHYQWYPFHNFGHYELAQKSGLATKSKLISFYREGIERVWKKSKDNAFYRGVPFIWCSNNLTTSFAIQCYLYRKLSGDDTYIQLEQACVDWLFGCNPWGTGMVYGLPANADTPADPHSSLTHLNGYSLDGGLVDGPVYGNIYKNLIGIVLHDPDEYADFQSDLAVYHDDFGDFSTNEPTMDGTASLVYLLAAQDSDSPEVGQLKK
ncbi:glycoside hydrolase family 9 protein [Rubrolithibacter danxiaensis]|uniref:glycoside hydrolase family 9 protein n=1 Tax=Rubrolithibacter danxiaensis TaxID=3390805 RepID=UPI003BF7FE8F